MSEKTNRYEKLGGWLLLFVIVSIPAALAGLFMAITIFGFAMTEAQSYFGEILKDLDFMSTLVWVVWPAVLGCTATLLIICTVQLCCRKARFLSSCQWMVIGSVVFYLLILVITIYQWQDSHDTNLLLAPLAYAPTAVGPGLLMLYYVKSVRVRTYMGSDEYLRLAFFAKKVKGPEPAVPDAAEKIEIPVEEGDS